MLKRVLLSTAFMLLLASWQVQAVVVVNQSSHISGTYTVPNSGQVTITITGADGGSGDPGRADFDNGGSGAEISGVFDVTAGQVIRYVVGEAGDPTIDKKDASSGGGGSTGVYIDTTLVLVAGAGGGGNNGKGDVGLGGNSGINGDAGTGDNAGAGGIAGSGGGANTDGESAGGGGVLSDGGSAAADGGEKADTTSVPNTALLIDIAAGGAGFDQGSDGGDGFTGGGGAAKKFSGGGGGYSGGGAAGKEGSAGGGGSYINTTITGYVSSSATAGVDGGAGNHSSELDGSIIVDLEIDTSSADMVITKSVDVPNPMEGDSIIYTLTATNNGPNTATGVVLTDTLPSSVSYVNALFTVGSGSCSAVGQTVTCTVTGSVANGASVTARIVVIVNAGLGDVAVTTNTASVSANETDPVPGNSSDTAEFTSCPDSNILNSASVTTSAFDTNAANNTSAICTEALGITIASIDSFSAYDDSGEVMVRWETGYESGTLGFHLERWNEAESSFIRVNESLLPGNVTSFSGTVYHYHDASARPGERYIYRLVEVDNIDSQRHYGAWEVAVTNSGGFRPVEDERVGNPIARIAGKPGTQFKNKFTSAPRARDKQTLARFELAREASGFASTGVIETQATQSSRKGKGKAKATSVKLVVRENGFYTVSATDLAMAFGEKEKTIKDWIKKTKLEISHSGTEVAFTAEADSSAIMFYAEAIDSVFTRDNVYWVRQGKGDDMASVSGASPAAENSEAYYPYISRAEVDQFPITILGGDPDADYFYWSILGVYGKDSTDVSAVLPGGALTSPGAAATGTACLTAKLHGYNDDPAATADHLVWLRVNGADVGEEESWDGVSPHTYTACFEQDEVPLIDGDNDVRLAGRNTGDVTNSIVLINNYELSYQRHYRTVSDQIWVNGGGNPVITVDGFSTGEIEVIELANVSQPGVVTDLTIEAAGAGYRVSFVPVSANTPYLVQHVSKRMTPAVIQSVVENDLKDSKNKADHLLIAPASLAHTAQDLADYRSDNELDSKVVTLENIYNSFSDGIVNPHAIQDFLAYTVANWDKPPVYVALVGKGSLDHKDALGEGGNLFPVLKANTPWGLYACDSCYGDLDNDGISEFSIGRIPVLSNQELQIYQDKLVDYESQEAGAWSSQLFFSADNPDHAGDFIDDSMKLSALVAGDNQVEESYLGTQTEVEVHDALVASFGNSGLVNWLGHGNFPSLADEKVLILEDILGTADESAPDYKPGMSNGSRLPLFAALTCSAGRFEIPGLQSLSEALVLREDGGAIAAFTSTGLSANGDAVILNEGLLRSLYIDGQSRIGDAALDAQRFYKQHPYRRFMLDIYSVTGDPATRLH